MNKKENQSEDIQPECSQHLCLNVSKEKKSVTRTENSTAEAEEKHTFEKNMLREIEGKYGKSLVFYFNKISELC